MVILPSGKVANWRSEVADAEEGKALVEKLKGLYPTSSPSFHQTLDGLHVWAYFEQNSDVEKVYAVYGRNALRIGTVAAFTLAEAKATAAGLYPENTGVDYLHGALNQEVNP